jgi:hypothetical protein
MPHLQIDPAAFAAYFDRKPFHVGHTLGSHPLLALPEMAALAMRLPRHHVEWDDGQSVEREVVERKRTRPPDQTIIEVESKPAQVILRRIEQDPRYAALLDEILDEVKPHSEKVRPGMFRREGFLFISSRQTVTPFHFDPEHNFLLQIRGRKVVHMWDPEDRFVLPEAVIERFYLEPELDPKPPYQENFLSTAWVVPLPEGKGLNFPLHAPHWVRTESEVSISLSVTFRSLESKRRQVIYTANGNLRKLGVPAPRAGTSPLWDRAAYYGYRAWSGIKSRLGNGKGDAGQGHDRGAMGAGAG